MDILFIIVSLYLTYETYEDIKFTSKQIKFSKENLKRKEEKFERKRLKRLAKNLLREARAEESFKEGWRDTLSILEGINFLMISEREQLVSYRDQVREALSYEKDFNYDEDFVTRMKAIEKKLNSILEPYV